MEARAKKLEDTVPGTRIVGFSRKVKTEVKIEASPKGNDQEKKINHGPKDHLQEHQRGAEHSFPRIQGSIYADQRENLPIGTVGRGVQQLESQKVNLSQVYWR